MKEKLPLCLIGEDSDESIAEALGDHGFCVYRLPRFEHLAPPIASHPDTLLFVHEKNIFCNNEYCKLSKAKQIFDALTSYGYKIIPCDAMLGERYPRDIAYNVFCTSTAIYGKLEHTADEIIDYTRRLGLQHRNVKQGYAKCSTLVLGEVGVISADTGITDAAASDGINVLKISNSPDAVSLLGYDYGFIGGACGVYKNKVYFTGNIALHPDGAAINTFCKSLGFDTVCLTQNKLCDIGGIMFFEYLNKN